MAVSRASRDALAVLGSHIKTARHQRRWTQAELAGRIGVDWRTLSAVERGSPSVAIGTVFNAAFSRKLFERIVFNIAVGNIDDHARNHAAFWDGHGLELTPAYDLCPRLRSGTEARQAMDITADGQRDSRFAVCVEAAPSYGLTPQQAKEIIDRQVTAIQDSWDQAADEARLTRGERGYLWGRQILNRYAFSNYS